MQWQEFYPSIRHLPAKEMHRIQQAFQLGKKMHGEQKRKSGEPYFNHPIAVAHMLSDLGADADTLIAALLHDSVEDTPLTLEEIDRQFGGKVSVIVDGVSKLCSDDVSMSPKLDEQTETLRKIFTLMQEDVRIMVVKLIDRLHNMQTIEFLSPERQMALARETLEFYVKIADKLCMRDIRNELESLCLSVLEPKLFQHLVELKASNEQRSIGIIEHLKESLLQLDRGLAIRTEIMFGNKTWSQLKAQAAAGDAVVTGITFIAAVLICPDVDSCYRVLGALHQKWKREILSFRDFINSPQLNGYEGIHTTIIAHDGTRVRCKIRTKEMNVYAHHGVTTVCFKGQSNINEILPWTKHISSLSTDTEGSSDDFWQNLQSDILGDSIAIQGPDDTTMQLPKGATALDGAFYLLQEDALHVSSIKIDGVDVPFLSPLSNGVSLDFTTVKHVTCTLDWLRNVQTGFAAAKIRIALAKQSELQKEKIGREVLKEILKNRKHQHLEEFDEGTLERHLTERGYPSIRQTYQSIGDGRLEPMEIFEVLFEKPGTDSRKERRTYVLTFEAPMSKRNELYQLLGRSVFSSMKIVEHGERHSVTFTVSVFLTNEEVLALRDELLAKGIRQEKFSEKLSIFLSRIAVPVLSLLWGLDCLLGKMLIIRGVSPYDLTTLRFATLFMMSLVYLLLQAYRSRQSVMPSKLLSPFNRYLFLSGSAIFLTALFSYTALQTISTLTYGMCMNIGIAAVLALEQGRSRFPSWRIIGACIALILGALLLLLLDTGTFWSIGFLGGIGCGLGFALYSYASQRYQTEESVHSRYPQFIFFYSSVALLLSIPLVSITHFTLLDSPLFLWALLFVAFLTALPYIVYFELLKYKEVKVTWSYIPLFLLIMTIGEFVLYQSRSWTLLIPLLVAVTWQKFSSPSTLRVRKRQA